MSSHRSLSKTSSERRQYQIEMFPDDEDPQVGHKCTQCRSSLTRAIPFSLSMKPKVVADIARVSGTDKLQVY